MTITIYVPVGLRHVQTPVQRRNRHQSRVIDLLMSIDAKNGSVHDLVGAPFRLLSLDRNCLHSLSSAIWPFRGFLTESLRQTVIQFLLIRVQKGIADLHACVGFMMYYWAVLATVLVQDTKGEPMRPSTARRQFPATCFTGAWQPNRRNTSG